MKNKWHKEAVSIQHPVEAEPVPIVADASVATVAIGDGRMIPLLILDTSKRPDIEDMVKAHLHMRSQGDVNTRWALCANVDETPSLTLISEQGGKEDNLCW